jgi:hypothetical protein
MVKFIIERKILFSFIVILFISIIINIVLIFNSSSVEEMRLNELDVATKHKIENEKMIDKYQKILDIYKKRLEVENECIELNSYT